MNETSTEATWIIGRAEDCDLIVRHPTVGSHHCRLSHSADGFTLADLDSANGTYVNGVRIAPREPVPVPKRARLSVSAGAGLSGCGVGVSSAGQGTGCGRPAASAAFAASAAEANPAGGGAAAFSGS